MKHYLHLILFFSITIVVSFLIVYLLDYHKRTLKIIPSPNQSVLMVPNLQFALIQDENIIKKASLSGSILCTQEDPGLCREDQQGEVLEYKLGCTSPGVSSGSIYICKKGRWVYIQWTGQGSCGKTCL